MTYLIDNQGQIMNTWNSHYEPGQSVYLLENGHLLHCCLVKGPGSIGGGEGGRLEEYDWDGNLVWEYNCSDNNKMMHHDIEPLPNGNVLVFFSNNSVAHELSSSGEVVQEMSISGGGGLGGYLSRRADLYGPPPPWGD